MMSRPTGAEKIRRGLWLLSSIVLWGVGVHFSAEAFGFVTPGYEWLGYALGLFGVTSLELTLNHQGLKAGWALFACCVVAYLYGVFSNVVGIWLAQGASAEWTAKIMPLTLGMVLEIAPEPMFLIGLGQQPSDVVRQVWDALSEKSTTPPSSRPRYSEVNRQRPMYGDSQESRSSLWEGYSEDPT